MITRTARACASYLAALPSTRAIETRLLPSSLAAIHRGFAFYVAFPKTLHSLTCDVFYVADHISSIRGYVSAPPSFQRISRRQPVLELGSVPLPVVTARIDRFIAEDGKGSYLDME